ncbi:MAG: right-handed parallel beta-helix repeat-containing protein [Phycisphaerae bacterium]|jgi:hypothetical protein
MFTGRSIIGLSFICLFILFVSSSILYAEYEPIRLYTNSYKAETGGVAFNCYPSGYSDGWWWGETDRHEGYGYHETLSGEWATAIYYTGIHNNVSNWFEKHFLYPYWDPDTSFEEDTNFYYNQDTQQWQSWHVWNNNRTAQSRVYDPNIQVTIDYNIIDLGENGYVSMPFYPEGYSGSDVPYVTSERYILIQTYNITNTHSLQSGVNITGLKFYQMLDGLVTLSGAKSSTYSNANIPGLLTGYDPTDPTVVFKYVITQWNNYEYHTDWISFACSVEPTSFENGIYDTGSGGDSTPGYVTYDIRNCNLNNDPNVYDTYGPAGAMGWDLGTLAPNQTKSITVAAMFGTGPIQYAEPIPPLPPGCEDVNLSIDTTDVEDCVVPSVDGWIDSVFDYNICYHFGPACSANDINIVSTLDDYVDYNDSSPEGYYDPCNHTVTWTLGDLQDVNESNCITLTVRVAEGVIQGRNLENTVRIYQGSNVVKTVKEYTKVCCLYDTVFVDNDAPPEGDGKSWDTAYDNLQDALNDVWAGDHGCADKIFVAAGTYYPTNDANQTDATFTLVDGVDIYGHFEGWETSIDQRNLADINSTTTLSGVLNQYGYPALNHIVTAADCHIDGFTVTKGTQKGIYCYACLPTIVNCVVKYNNNGIYIENSPYAAIINTFVTNNNTGINGPSNSSIDINECTISLNSVYGLTSSGYTMNVTDSIFGGNSFGAGFVASGIEINGGTLAMQNCDVNDNKGHGIYLTMTNASIQRCRIQRNSDCGLKSVYANASLISNIIADSGLTGVYIFSNYSGDFNLINNLIYHNSEGIYSTSNTSPGIYNNTIVSNDGNGISNNGDPNINSNIIWGNANSLNGTFTKVNYNCIQNYTGGGTNRNDNPQFRDSDANNFHLTADSNCIDNGNPNFVAEQDETDIDGEDRIINGRVDIGADEYYKNPADFNNDGIVDWADMVLYSDNWLEEVDSSMPANFVDDDVINFLDFAVFSSDWHWREGMNYWAHIGGSGAYFEDTSGQIEMMMSEQSEPELLLMPAQMQAEAMTVVQVEPQVVEIEQVFDVNQVLDWLDELWKNDEEFIESMSEQEYLEFRKSIEDSEK